jgi:hypothetical protein
MRSNMGLKKELDSKSSKSETETCESLISIRLEERTLNIAWENGSKLLFLS